MKSKKKAIGTKTPVFTPTNLNLTSLPVPLASLAINNYGQIVGTIGASNFEQAFLWQPESKYATRGEAHALPSADGCISYAVDINGRGEVTGYMMAPSGNMAQVIWKPDSDNGVPSRLPVAINNNPNNSIAPGQLDAYGGINDLGWVASDEFDLGGKQARATFFPAQKPIVELSPNFWGARAINNKCQIVGHASAAYPNAEQPVRWTPDLSNVAGAGVYKFFLDSVPYFAKLQFGAATDVNDNGDAAVGGNLPDEPFSPVIIWNHDNSYTDLTPALEKLVPNPPTPSENTPFGINKDRCVVGTLDTSLAFLYEDKSGLAYNLTSCCILKKSQTLQLGAANDINDFGQIVATGTLDNVPGAFLLTPA